MGNISGEILHLKLLIFKNVNIETQLRDLKSHCESINEVNDLSNSVTVSINKTKLNLLSELKIHILYRTYRSSNA